MPKRRERWRRRQRSVVNGFKMEQWQYEVTGAGRLWHCIDDANRTVWLTDASVGHPKLTE